MTPSRTRLIDVLRTQALRRFDDPVQLASGAWSHYFVDGKRGTAHSRDLFLAADAMAETAAAEGVDIASVDAVGGLTLGADALAVALARVLDTNWFFIRKQAKGRGTNQLVEGYDVTAGTRVFLVDDAVTTAGSILAAHDTVTELGALTVAATTLIDRGDEAAQRFAERGVPYFPMASYRDLDIPAVGTEAAPAD